MNYALIIPVLALPLLVACDENIFAEVAAPVAPEEVVEVVEVQETLDPPPPPPTARTVEQFDTTTAEDRAEAIAVEPESAGETRLGSTNVSLGSATDPGIWLKTGLVDTLVPGRVEYSANGKSVNLELRPSGGEASAASQMSLAAMRLLDIPLISLTDVDVYQRPASSVAAADDGNS